MTTRAAPSVGLISGLLEGLNPWGGDAAISAMSDIVDGATFASAMGWSESPESVWRMDEAGVTVTDLGSAGYNLTQVGTPTRGVTVSWSDIDVTTTTFNTTDSFDAASALAAQPGTGSMALVGVVEARNRTNARQWCGTRDPTTPFLGHELLSTTGGIRWNLAQDDGMGGSVAYARDLATPHNDGSAHVIMLLLDYANDRFGIITDLGETITTAPPSALSADSPANFAIGQNRVNAELVDHGIWAFFRGSAAEGLDSTHVANMASSLGI